MKNAIRRTLSVLLCLVILAGLLPAVMPAQTEARNYGAYEDLGKVYDQGTCPSMQIAQ